jgi:aspartate/methionine/tyrosine aminotransferase
MKDLASREDVIDLSQGIPAIEPPTDVLERAMSNLDSVHRYGPDGGDPELKEMVSSKLLKENGINANPDKNIMITAGANMGFLLAISAVCDVGDEVALVDPYYFNHQMTLDILGVRAIHVPTDADYMPNLAFLESAIGPRTRAVVIVSPNNPAGVVYPEELIVEIVELCSQRGIVLISDEAYEHFVYDTDHFSPASIEDP